MPVNYKGCLTIPVKFWLPVLVCMGIIFYASSIPGSNIPPLFSFQDVVFHFFIYMALAYLFARALKNTSVNITPIKIISFTLIWGFIYGLSDELHQIFVPGRCASGFDLLIDSLGSFTGAILYRWQR